VWRPTGTAPLYLGWLNAVSSYFNAQPGDLVKARVSLSPSADVATVDDVTQGLSVSAPLTIGSGPYLFGDGVNTFTCGRIACGPGPVANFDRVRIFSATINGVTPRAAGAIAINMQTTTGILRVRTGALNAAGNGCTEVWKHS
jgi:hypothetical protein